MSPASQGALEVERYIGSCLISSGCCKQQEQPLQHRNNSGKQFWAGGAPLMQQQQQQQSATAHNRVPLSRLAIHTQGAPLILSSQRYHNNRQLKQPPPLFNNISRQQPAQQQQPQRINNNNKLNSTPELKKTLHQQQPAKTNEANVNGTNVASIDSLSIASDESSGSNNSENSLPRIIKPRKRRKKDRKPLIQVNPPKTSTNADNNKAIIAPTTVVEEISSNSIVVQSTPTLSSSNNSQLEPTRLRSYSYDNGNQRYNNNNVSNNNNCNDNNYYRQRSINNRQQNSSNLTQQQPGKLQQQEVVDTRQSRFAHRQVQVKVLDDNRNVILPVPLCQAVAAAAAAAKANNYIRHQNAAANSNRFYSNGEPATLNCHSQDVVGNECRGGLCQCRYCDPATLIWDVADQASFPAQYLTTAQPATAMVDLNHHHRHHHHHHHPRYAQVPVFLTAGPIICQEHANAIEFFDVAAAAAGTGDNQCLRLRPSNDRVDGAALLRRSWSDPTSYFSDEIIPNRDVGVIGDRGGNNAVGGESIKSKNPWRGDALSVGSNSPIDQPSSPTNSSDSGGGAGSPSLQGPLEVSTEIVTSPNGHRDLEIKFYSSSPTALNHHHHYNGSYPGGTKNVTFAFPDEDDSEEYSDIWSYHESKLQQDFRTLLQAGED